MQEVVLIHWRWRRRSQYQPHRPSHTRVRSRREVASIDDSTHVSKLDSDVNRLFFEILPRLNPGVFVHFHDIFPGFEYPEQWLREGRAWNEQYLLRAFLQYNDHFHIRLFPGLLANYDRAWFEKNMPLVLSNPGGALWIEKLDNCAPSEAMSRRMSEGGS